MVKIKGSATSWILGILVLGAIVGIIVYSINVKKNKKGGTTSLYTEGGGDGDGGGDVPSIIPGCTPEEMKITLNCIGTCPEMTIGPSSCRDMRAATTTGCAVNCPKCAKDYFLKIMCAATGADCKASSDCFSNKCSAGKCVAGGKDSSSFFSSTRGKVTIAVIIVLVGVLILYTLSKRK